jgi:hypothetical protein
MPTNSTDAGMLSDGHVHPEKHESSIRPNFDPGSKVILVSTESAKHNDPITSTEEGIQIDRIEQAAKDDSEIRSILDSD